MAPRRSTRRRRGRNRERTPEESVEAGPSNQEAAAEEEQIWQPVWVAMFNGEFDGAFLHWAIFVGDEQDPSQGFICHVQGSAGRFRYEQRRTNAHNSETLVEMIQIGHVSSNNLRELRHVARATPIQNNDQAWNCQDFALDVVASLVEQELIEEDEIYRAGMATVESRREGLVEDE
jgi:hypothetical protein